MHIVIISKNTGFPFGRAGASRIRMIGRAMVTKGHKVCVLHMGASQAKSASNDEPISGIFEGIRFFYTGGTRIVPKTVLKRWRLYIRGLLNALLKMFKMRLNERLDIVYHYSTEPVALSLSCLLGRFFGFKVVVDLCEWHPSVPSVSRGKAWFMKNLGLSLPHGVIAISDFLSKKAWAHGPRRPKDGRVLTLPVLVDTQRFLTSLSAEADEVPYILWCGAIKGYFEDIVQIIDAVGILFSEGLSVRFRIVGSCETEDANKIAEAAKKTALPEGQCEIAGYVQEEQLLYLYKRATALILPVNNDVRSQARFPTKLAEYAAAGRPIVAGGAGEVLRYFRDGENAYLYSPGDVSGMANCIKMVLLEPKKAGKIAVAARKTAEDEFDFRAQAQVIETYFLQLL